MITVPVTPEKLIEIIEKLDEKRVNIQTVKVEGVYLWNDVIDLYHAEIQLSCEHAIKLLRSNTMGRYTYITTESIEFITDIRRGEW